MKRESHRPIRFDCRLFVSNLSYDCDKNDLRALFSQAGQVVDVYTPFSALGGNLNKGFAFVEMGTPQEAERAIIMINGKRGPKGRAIFVKFAKPKNQNE